MQLRNIQSGGVSSGGLVKRDKCDSRSGFRGFFYGRPKKTCSFLEIFETNVTAGLVFEAFFTEAA